MLIAGCQTDARSIEDREREPEFFRSTINEGTGNIPAPVGWVNDFADVISTEYEEELVGEIEALWDRTGVEIAVLTVQTFAPYSTIEDFSLAVADAWGVGSAERDDGVIIAVAMEERGVRIEVGYGLEGAIPDRIAAQILDESVVPHLSAGEFGAGLLAGVESVAELLTSGDSR